MKDAWCYQWPSETGLSCSTGLEGFLRTHRTHRGSNPPAYIAKFLRVYFPY